MQDQEDASAGESREPLDMAQCGGQRPAALVIRRRTHPLDQIYIELVLTGGVTGNLAQTRGSGPP